MTSLLVKLWHILRGPLQWYILWFFHAKFIVGVAGVVFNERGEVLLLKHRFWRKGSWGLPSGYAIRGEEVENTLKREVKEETNLDVEVLRVLRLVTGYKLRIEIGMIARLVGGIMALDGKEVTEARFFPTDQLPEGILDSHRKLVYMAISSKVN